jgi:hypothetical protein
VLRLSIRLADSEPAPDPRLQPKIYCLHRRRDEYSCAYTDAIPKDATVVAIEQIETILKKRDEALKGKPTSNAKSTLDEAEKNIDRVVPSVDRSGYELIRKKRYDYDQKYAPVCPAASY